MVGILVAVVWIGFSGRTTPPPVSVPEPVAVNGPTPASIPVATPAPTLPPTGGGIIAFEQSDIFGAFAELGNVQYITILAEDEPGHLTGKLRVPIPMPATEGVFYFQQFSGPGARGRPVKISQWPMRVEGLVAASGRSYTVVDQTFPARRTLHSAPRPVLRGFHIKVDAQSGVMFGELTIDVRIGPNQRNPGRRRDLRLADLGRIETKRDRHSDSTEGLRQKPRPLQLLPLGPHSPFGAAKAWH